MITNGQRTNKRNVFIGLGLFVLALGPRVWPLSGGFLNVDAALWIMRTKNFLLGLSTGQTDMLVQSGHPGVTVMWLTSAAEWLLQRTQLENFLADPIHGYVTILKLPLALATSGLVVLVWWLLRRATNARFALIIAGLLAIDPLYLIYSRYLHLDALLTGLIAAGVVAHWLLVKTNQRNYAILSGVLFGLALLTRFNAIIAVMFVLAVWPFFVQRPWKEWRKLFVIWVVSITVTIGVLWPVLVVAPAHVFSYLRQGYELGFSPHEVQPNVDTNPFVRSLLFPMFYVVREFPIVLGLFVLGIVTLFRKQNLPHRDFGLYLLSFGIIFLFGTMFVPKQLARYILPGLITIVGLSGFGLWWLLERLRIQRRILVIALGIVFVLQLGIFWRLGPWYQTYQSSLARLVERTPLQTSEAFQTGWGEGLAEAADYLNSLPEPFPYVASWFPHVVCVYTQPREASSFPLAARPAYDCEREIQHIDRAAEADYLIFTSDMIGQRQYPGLLDDIDRLEWQPVKTIAIHGEPAVWIYRNHGGLQVDYPIRGE